MPNVSDPLRFRAFYTAAAKIFANENLSAYRLATNRGSPLFRYVSYRNSMPQAADAGRTLWLDAQSDVNNRWTGWGEAADNSAQGLYFSRDFLHEGQPFPEVDHYLNKGADPDALIAYFEYESGIQPRPMAAKAAELRSMFLFSTNHDLNGLDLRLRTESGEYNPLLEAIVQGVRDANPGMLKPTETLESLYTSENADFCRAVGNASLKKLPDMDFFDTTSVRDLKSTNSIMRAVKGVPLEVVDPQGRATFFVNSDKVGQGVYTVSDMVYNAVFEDPDASPPIDLPTRQQFRDGLIAVGDRLSAEMVTEYLQLLKDTPPSAATEEVGRRLLEVRRSLEQQDFNQALQNITQVQDSIRELDIATNSSLTATEVRALKMSQNAMASLSEMTASIELAGREIDAPPDVDAANREISDPDPDLLKPEPFDPPA